MHICTTRQVSADKAHMSPRPICKFQALPLKLITHSLKIYRNSYEMFPEKNHKN